MMKIWMYQIALFLLASGSAKSEEVPVVHPGHPHVNAALLTPFEADYEQLGTSFRVRVYRSGGEAPVLATLMIMEMPDGLGVDHVAHRVSDAGLAYRRFTFGRWGKEYVEARWQDDGLSVTRAPLESAGGAVTVVKKDAPTAVFDGTFIHWLLAALPLADGYAARLASWRLTEDSAEIYETPVARVVGRETIEAMDGTAYDCFVVESKGSGPMVRNYLVQKPPFLVKQVMIPPEGEPMTTLMLRTASPD